MAFALFSLLLASGCATTPPAGSGTAEGGKAATDMPLATDDRYCITAQQRVAATGVPTVNVVHTDFQAFTFSKPKARPLETTQYVWFEDEAKTRPKMISCKMKTADHIRAEYGADQSGGDTSCAALNERTTQAVLAALTPAERRKLAFDGGRNVVYDPDFVTTDGLTWLAPFEVARVDDDGVLHIASKGMKNDWLDPKLANAAERFKGTRYCHLIAPEYLKRLLLAR